MSIRDEYRAACAGAGTKCFWHFLLGEDRWMLVSPELAATLAKLGFTVQIFDCTETPFVKGTNRNLVHAPLIPNTAGSDLPPAPPTAAAAALPSPECSRGESPMSAVLPELSVYQILDRASRGLWRA